MLNANSPCGGWDLYWYPILLYQWPLVFAVSCKELFHMSTCTVYIHADTMRSCWLPSDWLYVPLRPSSIFCTASNWRVSSSRASLQVKIISYQSSFIPWSYKHIFNMDFYVCNNYLPYALLDKPKPKQCCICRLFRSI